MQVWFQNRRSKERRLVTAAAVAASKRSSPPHNFNAPRGHNQQNSVVRTLQTFPATAAANRIEAPRFQPGVTSSSATGWLYPSPAAGLLFQPLENRLDVVAKRSDSSDHPTDTNSRPALQQHHVGQNIPKQTHHGFKRPWEEQTPVTSTVRESGGGV